MDEMSGGKCLYVFMRVTDPNTQLPKNVLINWVPRHPLSCVACPCMEVECVCVDAWEH